MTVCCFPVRWLCRSALWCAGALMGASAIAQGAVPAADTCQPSPAAAPGTSPGTLPSASTPTVDRGFLWRIEKTGAVSWLYGTIHIGRSDWAEPGPQMARALQQSDSLALELDMADPATQAVLAEPVPPAVMARLLTPARQRRLDRQVAAACLPAGALAALRPVLQVTVLGGLAMRPQGLRPEWGSEPFLAADARRHARPVVALETARSQLQALTGDDETEESASVDEALDQLESGDAIALGTRLTSAWARSDWTELASYRRWCDCIKTPADERALRRLLDDRNPVLADGIAALHRQGGRVFAAVGALHMVGPQGVPALLAARGFKVTRIWPAP